MNDSIFFHEDFYKQIELIPKQNYFVTNRIINDLPDSEGSELGFLSCTIRPKHVINIIDKKIQVNDIKNTLEPLALSFHDKITSGYSTNRYDVVDTIAWGFETYGIFIEHNRNLVKSIWLCHTPAFSSNGSGCMLYNALFNLSIKFDLILVDWNEEIVVDTTNKKQLKRYLNQNLVFDILD